MLYVLVVVACLLVCVSVSVCACLFGFVLCCVVCVGV